MKSAKDRFKAVQRIARLNVKVKLSNSGRLDLWGLEVKPNPALVIKTSISLGFSLTDAAKLVFLMEDTLAMRAL